MRAGMRRALGYREIRRGCAGRLGAGPADWAPDSAGNTILFPARSLGWFVGNVPSNVILVQIMACTLR